MAVTLHPPENPRRFRVTRTWKGVQYQSFVPFGKDIAKAQKKAEEIDESLAQRQRAYKLRRVLEGAHVLRIDGKIVGLNFHVIHRRGRKPFERFHYRFESNGRVVFKDFVISSGTRTFDQAFILAVEFIADIRGVERCGSIFKEMISAKRHYENSNCLEDMENSGTAISEDELFKILSQEVSCFESKRKNKRVIIE